MRNKVFLFFLILGCISMTQNEAKKKIVIFTSTGGGGQVSINKALNQTLKNDYVVKSEPYFSQVLNAADPISVVTFGRYSGDDFYNYAQKKRAFRFLQATYEISRWYYYLFSPLIIKQTKEYLIKEKPDLVISIIPIVNDIIAKSCKDLAIPFLIIPADLDVSFYTKDMQPPYSKDLYVALPFNNTMSKESIKPTGIPDSNIFSFKYPLRHDFYEKKDINKIKKEFNITDSRPIILLMMGAQGSSKSYDFAQQLTTLKAPSHILICIGKNTPIKSKIRSLTFPSYVTPHIIEYTDRISDLMAISTLMISKTGAISVIEALSSTLPIIADQTEYVLSWELFHQQFIEKHNCGLILKKASDLTSLVTTLLDDKKLLNSIKDNIVKIQKEQSSHDIKPLIEKIFNTKNN